MTPQEHYEKAEFYAQRAANTHGAAADAAIRHAILAVAHALLAQTSPVPQFIGKKEDESGGTIH